MESFVSLPFNKKRTEPFIDPYSIQMEFRKLISNIHKQIMRN